MPNFVDLSGQKYGRWTAIKRVGTKCGGALWLCKCECGNEAELRSNALRTGSSKSCGCLASETARRVCIDRNTTHGEALRNGYSPTYKVWINLGTRKYHSKYDGIAICDRWSQYENFLADMGERPSPAHTIDRIDNSKGYDPSNCRWATMKEQQNNRTNNRKITAFGKTQTLMQWSYETGISRETIAHRIGRNWSPERAVSEKAFIGKNQY